MHIRLLDLDLGVGRKDKASDGTDDYWKLQANDKDGGEIDGC